ncbi:MAG: hypothetical protein JXA20_01520 [Spirochaetes bacterium]|nr:hypothetical protein [Spirochaetota bacterium]
MRRTWCRRASAVIVLSFMMNSGGCIHSHYENVRLKKDGRALFFCPDRNAPREPMPLNIRARFAAADGRWGILLWMPYRETGLRAINRTLFTTVLYLAAVDGDLNQLMERPATIYRGEGNIRGDIFAAPGGFGVAYVTRDDRLICSVYDAADPDAVKSRYDVAGGSRVLMTDDSMTDMAISLYRDRIYCLLRGKNLTLLDAGESGPATEKEIAVSSSVKEVIRTGDLYVDDSGIHVLWAAASRKCDGAECTSFNYAFCPHGGVRFTTKPIPVRGDSPSTVKVSFGKNDTGLHVLLQEGNTLWEGRINGEGNTVEDITQLISVGRGKYPSPARYACTAGDCYVFFQTAEGPRIFSKKRGLVKGGSIQYRRAAACGRNECIQETSNEGISILEGM